MTTTTADLVAGLLPSDSRVPESFVTTLIESSIALQVSNLITPSDPSHVVRLPMVAASPTASWVAEGEEIEATDAELDEAVAEYFKIAGLTILSREAIRDADAATLDLIMSGLARDIARKVDAAYFGTAGASTVQPPGLGDLEGVDAIATAGTGWTDLDPFIAARLNAAAVGSNLTAWVTSPTDAGGLAMIRESEGSARGLLQPDPTQPTRSLIDGLPVLVTPAVEAGTVWGVPQLTSHVVVRQDIDAEASDQQFFTSQRVAVVGSARVGFAWTHPAGIARITTTAA